jgi:hypothetical protein
MVERTMPVRFSTNRNQGREIVSIALGHMHHAYAQTDGTYKFPDSREGDILKQAKKELEELEALNRNLKESLDGAAIDVSGLQQQVDAVNAILKTMKCDGWCGKHFGKPETEMEWCFKHKLKAAIKERE